MFVSVPTAYAGDSGARDNANCSLRRGVPWTRRLQSRLETLSKRFHEGHRHLQQEVGTAEHRGQCIVSER